MSTSEADVLEAAETFGDALVDEKDDLDKTEFFGLVMQCNQAIEQEIGIDYGSVCGEDDCC